MRVFGIVAALLLTIGLATADTAQRSHAAGAPILVRVAPTPIVAGSPGSYFIAATGANFTATTRVLVNDVDVGGLVLSDVRLVFQLSTPQLATPTVHKVKLRDSVSLLESAEVDLPVVSGTNPVPFITGVAPSTLPTGVSVAMSIIGANFGYGSSVFVDGQPLISSTQSETRMLAIYGAPATPGIHTVVVVNEAPGGGTSNEFTFAVVPAGTPPKPDIVASNPASIQAGTPGALISITVEDLLGGATVTLNGTLLSVLNVTQVADDTLLIQVPGTMLAAVGNLEIIVTNPGGASGVSDPFHLPVVADATGAPLITSLEPDSVAAGGPGLALTVHANSIGPAAYVAWNGTPISSAPFGSDALIASVPKEYIATEGAANITVVNPLPGGGTSAPAVFTIGPAAPAPMIDSAPSAIPRQDTAYSLTLTGSGLTPQSVLDFGGTLVPASNATGSTATYDVPPAALQTLRTVQAHVFIPGGSESSTVEIKVISRADADCSGPTQTAPDGVDATDIAVALGALTGLNAPACSALADGDPDLTLEDPLAIARILAGLDSAP